MVNASYLYTPALKADSVIAKRHEIGADAVVFDLEDSTHVSAKSDARGKMAEFDFSPLKELGIETGMRINTIASYDGLRDLELLRVLFETGTCPIRYVFLPKVHDAREVDVHRSLLGSFPNPPQLISFIETVAAVDNADEIAKASDGLCFGQVDLVAEMYSPNEAFVDYARARLCIAAARCKIQAIDTNSFEIEDMARFHAECQTAKGYGFTGKAAIHPAQVHSINEVFRVTEELIAKYRATVQAYEDSKAGFFLLDGEFVAPPFVAKAKRMLEFYAK